MLGLTVPQPPTEMEVSAHLRLSMAASGTEEMIDWMWHVVGLLGQG